MGITNNALDSTLKRPQNVLTSSTTKVPLKAISKNLKNVTK